MVLGAYRLTRLVVKDTFPPVLWVRDRLAGGWRKMTPGQMAVWWKGAPYTSEHPGATVNHPELGPVQIIHGDQSVYVHRVKWSPDWLAELITCPWCASAYVSGALTAAVDITVGLPLPWLTGLAVWAGASLLASKEWA
jgi:hypothetical protein